MLRFPAIASQQLRPEPKMDHNAITFSHVPCDMIWLQPHTCMQHVTWSSLGDASLERYVRLCSKLTQHTNELYTPSNINASAELKSDHLAGAKVHDHALLLQIRPRAPVWSARYSNLRGKSNWNNFAVEPSGCYVYRVTDTLVNPHDPDF